MIRLKWVAMCLTASALLCGNAFSQATVYWTGHSFSTPDFSDPMNWVFDTTPANDGSQVLGFFRSDAMFPNGNQMTLNVAVNAKGLDIEADTGGANISLIGAGPLTLGSSGIWMNQTNNHEFSVATITTPVILSANQTWALTNSSLQVTHAISESSAGTVLTVSGGAVDFGGNNTFSGGANLNNTTVTIGTDTGLGTGPVTATNSTLDFNSMAPGASNPSFSFTKSTVNFNHSGANPSLSDLSLSQATLNFSPGTNITINNLATDSAASGNSINIDNGSTLILNENGNATFYGTITGFNSSSVSVTSDASGTVDLFGANTYGHGTTISSGALVVADNNLALGSGPASSVTINGGALEVGPGITIANQISVNSGTVVGYGTIDPGSDTLLFQGEGFVAGGKGTLGSASGQPVPGTLTFGPGVVLTLGPGGAMQFSIMNATGTPGTDFSTIHTPGNTVNITATPVSPFTIQLVAVNPGTGQFLLNAANFNNSTAYSWTLLSAGTINGFAANEFKVEDTTDFQSPFLGGTFSVADVSNSLVLNFTPVPEPSTWALMATGLCALGAAVRRRRR